MGDSRPLPPPFSSALAYGPSCMDSRWVTPVRNMPSWPRKMERRMWMNGICFRKCFFVRSFVRSSKLASIRIFMRPPHLLTIYQSLSLLHSSLPILPTYLPLSLPLTATSTHKERPPMPKPSTASKDRTNTSLKHLPRPQCRDISDRWYSQLLLVSAH